MNKESEIIKEPKIGDEFWSISPPKEGMAYGDFSPRKPWKGIITKIIGDNPEDITYSLTSKTEEGFDVNTNNSFFVGREDLFKNLKEAREAYIHTERKAYTALLINAINSLEALVDYENGK